MKTQLFENTEVQIFGVNLVFKFFPDLTLLEGGKEKGVIPHRNHQKLFYFLLLDSLFRSLAPFLQFNYILENTLGKTT